MLKIEMAAMTMIAIASAPLSAKPAAEFLKDAVQGDRSEMTLGNVIKLRGASPQVRAYGATLEEDNSIVPPLQADEVH